MNLSEIKSYQQSLKKIWSADQLPGMKDPNYRYSSLKKVDLNRENESLESEVELSSIYLKQDNEESWLGIHSDSQSPLILNKSESIWVGTWKQAFEQDLLTSQFKFEIPELLNDDPIVQKIVSDVENPLVILVKKNKEVNLPLRMVSEWGSESSLFMRRIFLVLEEGASLDFIEENVGEGKRAPLDLSLLQIYVGKSARLNGFSIQNFGLSVEGYHRTLICADADSFVSWTPISLGGEKVQSRLETHCLGKGAEVVIDGAARGYQKQHLDFWVTAHHTVPETRSSMNYATVMADQGRSVFNGNMIISREGVRTEAYQKNRNMLLSPHATIDTLPKLEIGTDEVQCAHGASIAPVDPSQLFYLQSRGIPKELAEAMVVDGFTESVVSRIPIESVKERINESLSEKSTLSSTMKNLFSRGDF
tara:strand:+ start:2494 stop:3753 length:1260 start_codon:yes stop_codon:yes gene_type:complete